MAQMATTDYTCGDTVTIIATNKPYTDMLVQPQVNDYRWADSVGIKIFNEINTLVIDSFMCRIEDKVGWYNYRFKTNCDCGGTGIFRVEITMNVTVSDCHNTPDTTGSSGTSGTSGSPGQFECNDIVVYYFRVNPRR
jgi:hypothetical protein